MATKKTLPATGATESEIFPRAPTLENGRSNNESRREKIRRAETRESRFYNFLLGITYILVSMPIYQGFHNLRIRSRSNIPRQAQHHFQLTLQRF